MGHFLTIVPLFSRSCSFNNSGSIAVGDLCARDAGKDETKYRDSSENDNVLVAEPIEGHVFVHKFKEAHHGESAHYEKEGDED